MDEFSGSFWRTQRREASTLGELTATDIDDASFRVLASHLPTLCWVANGDGYIVWYNQRWHDYCGSSPKEMEGWGWQSVHDPGLLPSVLERWTASIAHGEPFEMIFPLRGADGVFRPFLTRIAPVRDGTGRVVRWCGVNTEISVQLAAEQALRAERDRAQGVLENMREAFALLDAEFRIVDINREAMRLETRPREAIIGKTHWEVYPGTEHSELGQLYKSAMESRMPVSLEHRYVWEDGRAAWLEMRAYPTEGGLAIFYRDVTDRKREELNTIAASESAAASAAEREAVLGQLAEAVIVADAAGQIIFVNEAAERLHGVKLLGVTPDAYATSYHLLTEDGDPYPPRQLPLARAVLDRETVKDARWRIDRPDGTRVLAIGSAQPIIMPNGTQSGAVLTARDDTARSLSENALRETEQRYRLAARATNDAIWDWRMADGHVVWNEALKTLFGHDLNETTAQWWVAHIHPDDRQRVEEGIHAVIDSKGDGWLQEYRFRKADDSYAQVLDRGTVLRNAEGTPVRMIGAMLDLTVRKAQEEALKVSEERLRLATEAAEVGFWDVDLVEDTLVWPPSVKAMFGISADKPVTMTDFYNGLHPDDREATSEAFSAAADASRRALYDVEYRTVGKEDGIIRWVAAKGRGFFDNSGRCVRVVGTAIDVSRRKAAEAELRGLNEHLESRVAEEVAERLKAEEALRQSQKMEAVGQLTGGIAHDFNNMLAVVIGSLELLERRIGVSDARAKRYVDAAADGARRAAQLTKRLLAFSRQQPLKPEAVDVNKLVAGMSDLLTHALGSDVRLEAVLAAGLWRTHVDPNQLENVILNLAVNSRDAMPEGGRLTIETANCHLDPRYVSDHIGVPAGQYVMVAISDTGAGMTKDVIAKAFDPFFTTKEVGRGTGLGLSQVYGFVKQSGGHVKIYSELGQGTAVKVYLPRLVHDIQETSDADALPPLSLGDGLELILVVEDESAVRQFSVEALKELGYRVLEADGAAAALTILDAHPDISLLFTDVVMPEMNGARLAEEAKRRRPDLKVLFTTGYTRNAVVHNGVVDADVLLIGKPFTIDELAARVREALDTPTARQSKECDVQD